MEIANFERLLTQNAGFIPCSACQREVVTESAMHGGRYRYCSPCWEAYMEEEAYKEEEAYVEEGAYAEERGSPCKAWKC